MSFPRVLLRCRCFFGTLVVMFVAMASSSAQTTERSPKPVLSESVEMDLYRSRIWEWGLESAYTFQVVPNPFHSIYDGRIRERNPRDYSFFTNMVSLRYRLTKACGPWLLRGSLQASATALTTLVLSGPESYYAGFSVGLRYDFVQPGARLVPYIEMRGGPGVTDSRGLFESQQQDFTFNYLFSAGLRYDISPQRSITVGAFDQHLSNAYLADQNYGVDSLGITLGVLSRF
jgi:hypothetical protein